MLRVQRVYCKADAALRELALTCCAQAVLELPDDVLAKHYSWSKLAQWLCTEAHEDFMYVLYDGSEPIGIMCFSEAVSVHLDCTCVVDTLLYIRTDKRCIKHLLTLVRQSLYLLRSEFNTSFLVSVGSTLGRSSLPEFYKRLGFAQIGSHLILELQPL